MDLLAPISDSHTLTKTEAAHLLRRLTFNSSRDRIQAFTGMSVSNAVDQLLNVDSSTYYTRKPIDPDEKDQGNLIETADFSAALGYSFVTGWWVNEMLHDTTATTKIAHFFHTITPVEANLIGAESWEYARHFRMLYESVKGTHTVDKPNGVPYDSSCSVPLTSNSLGNFRQVLLAVTFDYLMLKHLNNNSNTWENSDSKPNENYARELMELFTIGEDIDQTEVLEAARVLTGINHPNSNTNPFGLYTERHDPGDKVVLGMNIQGSNTRPGMFWELEQLICAITSDPRCALYICRKIFRFFVHHEITPEIENEVIIPLAKLFRRDPDSVHLDDYSGQAYDFFPVFDLLFKSNVFFGVFDGASDCTKVIGGMVKSHIDLLTWQLSFFNVALPDQLDQDNAVRQQFYYTFSHSFLRNTLFLHTNSYLNAPEIVAGYPANYVSTLWDRAWYQPDSVVARLRLPEMLLTNNRIYSDDPIGVQINVDDYIAALVNDGINMEDPSAIVLEFSSSFFPHPTSINDRFNYFRDILTGSCSDPCWENTWNNDPPAAKIQITLLIKNMLESNEFQMM